jgi:hypothetical protein
MRSLSETLDNILKSLSREERVAFVREQFERSAEWEEHKRWHEDHGGEAVLRVWQTEVPAEHLAQAPRPSFEEPAQHKRTVKVGGCDCQPRAFMELTDKGEVVAGIPVPLENVKPYTGLLAGESEGVYGATPSGENQIYHANPGSSTDLYR